MDDLDTWKLVINLTGLHTRKDHPTIAGPSKDKQHVGVGLIDHWGT